MKLAFFSSVLCIILGLGIVIGGAIAYPFVNSALNDLETTAANTLNRANNALLSAQGAINSTQVTLVYLNTATNVSLPSLERTGQLTGNIANNLTAIASTVTGVGQTLSNISIAGVSPFTSVGNTMSGIGQPIDAAATSLQNVSSSINSIQQQTADVNRRLETITIQLGNVNSSLGDLQSSVVEAQNSLPATFNTVRLVVILAIVGVMGLGAIFILIGVSMLSLRRKTIELNYKLYAKLAAA